LDDTLGDEKKKTQIYKIKLGFSDDTSIYRFDLRRLHPHPNKDKVIPTHEVRITMPATTAAVS
jgi:hypothetical protein